MEYSSLITGDALLKLKCDSCSNYLSYFPIYVSNADKKNICGRCPHVVQENHVQNEIYEALAQFVKFPCRYKNEGCSESIPPQDIPEHERICDFRIVNCPTKQFTECDWEEARPSCLNHCQDKHFELMIKNYSFQLDLSQSYDCTNLLEHESLLFIVRQQFDSTKNMIKFSLCHIECEVNTNEFSYELSFKTPHRSVIIEDCTTSFNNEKITEICLDSLKEKKDTTLVVGNIKFKDCVVHVPVPVEVIFEELLTPFTCVTCNEFALPPIFCQDNNSLWGEAPVICSECRNGRKSLFGEINPIEGTRNFGLERIANLLNFPCKHRKNGCIFVSKPPAMELHLQSCLYGDHNCPLHEYCDCKWKGIGKNIVQHVLDVHSDMVLHNESIITENIVDVEVKNSDNENVSNVSTVSTSINAAVCTSSSSIFATPLPSTNSTTTVCSFSTAPSFWYDDGASRGKGSIFDNSSAFGDFFGAPTITATFGTTSAFGTVTSNIPFEVPKNSKPVPVFNFAPKTPSKTPTTKNTSSAISQSSNRQPVFRRRRSTPKENNPTATTDDTSRLHQIPSKCYVIKFSNRLFRLNFAVIDKNFQWTVQMIGPFEKGFMFELEVVDMNNKRSSLIAKRPCTSLKKKKELFGKHNCYFFHDQIANLVSQQIAFKVRIYKGV
ncbi:hypothetical protein Zmor_023746 [Zophobas morio]|uniref:RING-type E3 ubiquitin transferase n=1 Tax=Zophobas morio TaxID=2755281 RepID=A0AA38HZ41_9CUCU|nr:hypothetical protein Zmor_023746 [Zophobas morio]